MKPNRPTAAILFASLALMAATLSCSMFPSSSGVEEPLQPAATQVVATVPAAGESDQPATTPEVSLPTSTPEGSMAEPPATSAPPAEAPPTSNAPQTSCAEDTCILDGTFLLQRPIGSNGRNIPNASDRFGTYVRNTRNAFHGSDFLNSTGTPVLAAADGTVVVAGDDSASLYGPFLGYYGNLVILQHSLPGIDQPVYTLYSHLSQVSVSADQTVSAGQEIGQVGSSGDVSGSILYFEIRVGENSYNAVRNPELWIVPVPDKNGQMMGALVGRVIDGQGNLVQIKNIVVDYISGSSPPSSDPTYLKTYSEKKLSGQTPWGENFAAGDLPAGSYKISFLYNGMQQRIVDIQPGKVTFVTFQVQ